MIDWYGVLVNGLWIGGMAVGWAALSWGLYARHEKKRGWRGVLSDPAMRKALAAGLALAVLGFSLHPRMSLGGSAIGGGLALVLAWGAWQASQQQRGMDVSFQGWLRSLTRGTRGQALMLIFMGVLLASMYAWVIRPWMQPDEPRHYEVAMHDARLKRPGATSQDLVLAWEQELIRDMEAQSFWWYGYSVIGWDPEHLPQAFTEIWEPRYSRAFFQLPLYYDLAGLWLYAWGDEMSLSQSVILLRFLGIFWLGWSLAGIYAMGRTLFPQRPTLALTALAFAALWPSHLAANAAVNNDPMAEALVIWTGVFAMRLLRRGPDFRTLSLFFLCALLAIYTKRTAFSVLVFLGALPLWGLLQSFRRRATRRGRMMGWAVLLIGLAALPALFWLIQATGRYWLPDFLWEGLQTGTLWHAFLQAPVGRFLLTLYRTFWGWFGWLRVGLPAYLYGGAALLTVLFVGWMVLGYFHIFSHRLADWQRAGLLLLLLALLLQIILVLGKDVIYGDWQGGSVPQIRYLYPVFPALVLPFSLGLDRMLPAAWRRWVIPATVFLLALFNFYILGGVLYPFFWL